MDRRTLRDIAFKMLFEAEFKKDENRDELYEAMLAEHEAENCEYLNSVFFGVLENTEELDALISQFAKGWKLSRISRVSLNIMRLSVYELEYRSKDVPFAVSINEAVELAKKYDDDAAPKFINGILNSIAGKLGLK
ncbi:MAG: transcription antitermination factor NusB [Clostridia bacterium]|nr:transcription antitermination factor NusB [Clostridia bacterium]